MPGTSAAHGRTPSLRHRPRKRLDGVGLARGASGWRHRRTSAPEPRSTSPAGGRATGEVRVLLVDDESAIRTICRVNLEVGGMSVVEAADGDAALERVRAERPTLVLLDVMMPGVDGWTVAERLAGDPRTRDLPVVFLSARTGLDDRRRAHDLGAVGYIVKPFDPLQLTTTIETVLERLRRGERRQLCEEIVGES